MAVIVTAVEEATPVVVIVAPAEAEPAGIVTLAGMEATAAFELDNVTAAPPAGAGPLSVAVAVELFPPTGFVGLRAKVTRVGTAVTVSVAVFVTPRKAVEIVTFVFPATAEVVTVNVAVFAPAATVTLAGTVATDVFDEERVTTTPLPVALPVSVTVPVDETPPKTLAGLSVTEESAAGVRTIGAALVVPEYVAEIPTADCDATPSVVIVKVFEVVPAETVTLAGTVARLESELARVTMVPPVGAGPFSVTVPVTAVPPPTLAAAVTLERTAEFVTARGVVAVRPPAEAEMSEEVGDATATVETVKVAVFVAAATVTLAGTVATAPLELASVTTIPPVGAFPSRVTVPVAEAPPTRLGRLRESAATAAVGVTSMETCRTRPARLAEIVAVDVAATVFAVTVKVADVAPAATVTLAGTVATAVFELERATTRPPAGATAFRTTVAVTVVALRAAGAARVRARSAVAGVTSRVAARLSAPRVAVTVTVAMLATESV